MSKNTNGGQGNGDHGNRSGGTSGGRGAPSPTPNLPSTTGNPSGGGRGNAPPSK